jgi:hypothetical protein
MRNCCLLPQTRLYIVNMFVQLLLMMYWALRKSNIILSLIKMFSNALGDVITILYCNTCGPSL